MNDNLAHNPIYIIDRYMVRWKDRQTFDGQSDGQIRLIENHK